MEAKERESEGTTGKEKKNHAVEKGGDKNQIPEPIRIGYLLRRIDNQQEETVMVQIFEYDEGEPAGYLLPTLASAWPT